MIKILLLTALALVSWSEDTWRFRYLDLPRGEGGGLYFPDYGIVAGQAITIIDDVRRRGALINRVDGDRVTIKIEYTWNGSKESGSNGYAHTKVTQPDDQAGISTAVLRDQIKAGNLDLGSRWLGFKDTQTAVTLLAVLDHFNEVIDRQTANEGAWVDR